MSNYLPSVNCESEFEGDHITYTVKPIGNEDFGRLLPFFHENEDGEQVLKFEDQGRFLLVAGELLDKYVSGFTGLKDATGQPVPLEVVTREAYFMPLVSDMSGQLFNASMTGEVAEKNSGEPSEQG